MKALTIAAVRFAEDKLIILDQTKLPGEEAYIELKTKEDVWDAIYKLKVRGAPAIGIAAAYGLYICTRDFAGTPAEFFAHAKETAEYLNSSRPTAVNLSWAMKRMVGVLESFLGNGPAAQCVCKENVQQAEVPGSAKESCCKPEVLRKAKELLFLEPEVLTKAKELLFLEAEAIRQEDEAACYSMGERGLSLLKPGMGILTHCNAGTLAASRYGTCLAPIYLGSERGYDFKVFADETRPLLQGARLTSWELSRAGIDVTLICDNMAATVMKKGWIDAVVVGCDRMAANGDGANKIGTSAVAILAKHYGIPFYMFVPTSTIDLNTPTGEDIQIELREGDEIYKMWYAHDMAPEGVKTFNPSFDVTEADNITAIITEKGIVYPPYKENLAKLLAK